MATAATATPPAAANTPAPEAETSNNNVDFDTAFANLMKDESDVAPPTIKGPTPPAAEAPAAPDPNETPEAKAAREAAEAAAAGTGEEPQTEIEGAPGAEGADPADPTKPAAKPPAQTQQQGPDAITRLAELLAANQPKIPPAPAPVAPPPRIYSDDEMGALTQYRTDYADVARAEALIRRGEYAALTTHIFKQIGDFIAPQIALINQMAEQISLQRLTAENPDYATERQQIEGWITQQPDYLQQAYMGVMTHGTAEQVSHLFGTFRAATGGGTQADPSGTGIAPGATGRTPPAPARTAPELSPQAKQAAQRLAPVGGKRSAVTQAEPQTFDAAFDLAVKEIMAAQ